MSLKPLVPVVMACAGVVVFAGSASAQEWWNPVSWVAPRPAYPYVAGSSGYVSPCPGGVCRPNSFYGPYTAPYPSPAPYSTSRVVTPSYGPYYSSPKPSPSAAPLGARGTSYREPQNTRRNSSPFYE